MITLRISATGIDEAKHKMDLAEVAMEDMSPFYLSVARYMFSEAQRRIEVGGDPPWLPTKFPANAHPMLRFTGALYESLDPNQSVEASASGVQFGTDVPYASFQQFGVAAKSFKGNSRLLGGGGAIAPREFLYFDDANIDWIREEWISYFNRMMGVL